MTHSQTPHQSSSLLREAYGGTILRQRIGPRNSTDRLNHPIEEFILSTLQMDESDAYSPSFRPSSCRRPLPCPLLIPIPLVSPRKFQQHRSRRPGGLRRRYRRSTLDPTAASANGDGQHDRRSAVLGPTSRQSFGSTKPGGDPTAASANGDDHHERRSAVLGPTLSHWHCGPQKCDNVRHLTVPMIDRHWHCGPRKCDFHD